MRRSATHNHFIKFQLITDRKFVKQHAEKVKTFAKAAKITEVL
jgi:hypothetical protein